jgi:CHASE3 domain sensor protein
MTKTETLIGQITANAAIKQGGKTVVKASHSWKVTLGDKTFKAGQAPTQEAAARAVKQAFAEYEAGIFPIFWGM